MLISACWITADLIHIQQKWLQFLDDRFCRNRNGSAVRIHQTEKHLQLKLSPSLLCFPYWTDFIDIVSVQMMTVSFRPGKSSCRSLISTEWTQVWSGLTYRWPLSHLGSVWSIQELGLIVIDVLDLDDELGLGFQRQVGDSISSLSSQGVVGLLFPIQPFDGMYVSCVLIDGEEGPRAVAAQDVPHLSITFIQVRVELREWAEETGKSFSTVIIVVAEKMNLQRDSKAWNTQSKWELFILVKHFGNSVTKRCFRNGDWTAAYIFYFIYFSTQSAFLLLHGWIMLT